VSMASHTSFNMRSGVSRSELVSADEVFHSSLWLPVVSGQRSPRTMLQITTTTVRTLQSLNRLTNK